MAFSASGWGDTLETRAVPTDMLKTVVPAGYKISKVLPLPSRPAARSSAGAIVS